MVNNNNIITTIIPNSFGMDFSVKKKKKKEKDI